MTTIFNSLTDIANEYTIFEKDQILTEEQLNSVTRYLDDQDRLSRVHLCGVGVACGLRLSRSGNNIYLSPGVAITGDGDLVSITQQVHYTHFKPYDSEAPRYDPFYTSTTEMLPLFELVETGSNDSLLRPLSSFQAETGINVNNAVGVLLVESYVKDHDLCSGTDCNNHGQQYVSRNKVLLVSRAHVERLLARVPTAGAALRELSPLWAERPQFSAGITTSAQLAARLYTAASNIHQRILATLPQLWTYCEFVLQDVFSGNPTSNWTTRLNNHWSTFNNSNIQVYYYYLFLKDLVDTWNEILETLNTNMSWCNPSALHFPKHVLLGDLVPGADRDARRTGFYPATANSISSSLQQAIFLVRKLDAMIASFTLPASNLQPGITPSYTPDVSLQKRAIPAYYNPNSSASLLTLWNYSLSQQQREKYNYSIHAASYDALGAALSPLQYDIARHNFFRIEGHIGKTYTSVLANLQNQIATRNLPFAVHGLLVGSNRNSLLGKRGAGYNDLHRFHYLSRQDLAHRLKDVSQFSNNFKLQLDHAVDNGTVRNDMRGNDGAPVKTHASNKNQIITQKSNSAQSKLNQPYPVFMTDNSWMTDISDIAINAGQFKYDLGKVSKTEFATPFDGFIADTRPDWIHWLDILIRDKDNRADDKNMFNNFFPLHPGLESTGGVVRGGTLILLYDTSGTVVGDMMLSYHYQPEHEDTPAEPPLTRPLIPKDWVINTGIKIDFSLDNYVFQRLDLFKIDLDKEYKIKFDFGIAYGDIYKQSMGLIRDIYTYDPKTGFRSDMVAGNFQDDLMGILAQNARSRNDIINQLDDKLSDPTLSRDQRMKFQEEKIRHQKELTQDIESIASYVVTQDYTIEKGSDGYLAMQVISQSVNNIANQPDALRSVKNTIDNMPTGGNTNTGMVNALKNVLINF